MMKVIIIKSFVNGSVAELYRSKLRAEGIESFISNANTSTMIPFVNGGFNLHILDSDAEKATRIIAEMDLNFIHPPEQDFKDADIQDIIYEKSVHEYEEKLRLSSVWDLFVYGSVFTIIALTFFILFRKAGY